ncbi:MAG: T9SS type A sorting domain-containing protein, partial [Melioribacteraceae bacterium]
MKRIIIIGLFFINVILFAQVDTNFSGLRGYEDIDGNTQLFYRVLSDSSTPKGNGNYKGVNRNDIYHFDINDNLDSLFILDFVDFYQPLPAFGHRVSDFEFVDNTLTDFYQCGDGVTSFEPSPVVIFNRDYDNPIGVHSFHGTTFNMEITNSGSNTNVYVSTNDGVYTDSSGWGFDLIKTTKNFRLVSINKKHPNIMFVENRENNLYKSIDTGVTFFIVDSLSLMSSTQYRGDSPDFINRWFLYDINNSHIYKIGNNETNYYLQVSDNSGELNSWEIKFESESELFLSYDSTQSGLVYIATGNQIYESNNYGETFEIYKEIGNTISGIYKKPNSDLMYVATSHSLLEINSDSIKIIKQLTNYDELSYYPLQIGNYFEYIDHTWQHPIYDKTKFRSVTVSGDTLLENGEKYKVLLNKNVSTDSLRSITFERIDLTDGSVYRYNKSKILSNREVKIDSLFAQIGDTIKCSREGPSIESQYFSTIVTGIRNDSVLGIPTQIKSFWDISFIPGYHYDLANGFGFYNASNCEFGCGSSKLVYAKINGKEYGDKITSIDNENSNLVSSFKLLQNYPNPFNPTTRIQYAIPLIVKRETKNGMNVTLRVYDVLGREVEALVSKYQKPGSYEVVFDATNLSSGVYYYQLKVGGFIQTKKM